MNTEISEVGLSVLIGGIQSATIATNERTTRVFFNRVGRCMPSQLVDCAHPVVFQSIDAARKYLNDSGIFRYNVATDDTL